MEKLLELTDVHSYYGHIHALKGISLHVNKGEIVSLIGSNGAGKSTSLRTISGIIHAKKGKVIFEGQDITHTSAHEVVAMGMGHVPEGRGIFPKLTVQENLDMGAYTVNDPQLIKERMELVYQTFPRLKERVSQYGGTLSGGEQQMLAIGRGLMLNPRILMLDEPSMGLAPVLVDLIFETIKKLNDQGTTILLVEQNARMALQFAQRGYVLESGELVLDGPSDRLLDDPEVKKAYLGG